MNEFRKNRKPPYLLNACSFDEDSQEEYEYPCTSDHDAFPHLPKNCVSAR
jgi:hypothetical protein